MSFAYLFLANSWVGDDAYLTFRVVDNLVGGYGLRWNTAERVQAYTNPLWALLLSVPYLVTREIYLTSLAVSFVLCIAALAVGVRGLPRRQQALAFLILVCSSKALIDYTSSGLEYPLLYLLLAAFYVPFLTRDTSDAPLPPRLLLLSTLASLAFVARMDTCLLTAPPLLVLSWRAVRERGVRGLLPIALGGLPALGWLVFAVVYYGFPFPNTYYAKAAAGIARRVQTAQGVAYLLNSLRFDPVTLVAITTAALLSWGRRGPDRAVTWALTLNVAYVVWVGGDFMSGRFLAPAFLVAAFVLARQLHGRTAVVAVAGLLLGYNVVWPYVPAKTTASYTTAWPWRTQNGIKDERGGYFDTTNLLSFAAFRQLPSHQWVREGQSLRASPERVFARPSVGFIGYYAGPEKYIVDTNALGDALLAHLPVDALLYFDFHTSHFVRPIPAGYLESRQTGTNRIEDPLVRDYYDRLLRVTSGPIWSVRRFRDIWALNVGRDRNFHERVAAARGVEVSVPAGNVRFATDVGERLDGGGGQFRSTGRAGFLLLGPRVPFRAGEYRVEWMGVLEPGQEQTLGFALVCHDDCRKVVARVPVETLGYRPDTQTLASTLFRLPRDANDLECRLFVNGTAKLVVERIQLRSATR
jgi:arabinofuranosyltransferase